MSLATKNVSTIDEAEGTNLDALVRPRFSIKRFLTRFGPFLAIALQFGLIAMVVDYWHLESRSFATLMQLAFVGFLAHHLLPLRFRMRFFAILSILITVIVVNQIGPRMLVSTFGGKMAARDAFYQLVPGLALISIGLVLIGLCHIPIRFGLRVALIAVLGAALCVARAKSEWFPDIGEIWVILGSMFMFRLIIYLYDLKHRTAPVSPARAISYFFLLPNVCFPLFPVVDYNTFCSTYYNDDWPRIYQTGLKWMLRGVVQLLLYRIVYQYAPLDITKLSSALDVAQCMLGMYLLYLRISGTFHLIVGLLLMFGFNLPETHHLYYLATSFTDFWRRINIYWKDFVMKLFFYPTHFKFRKMGMLWALSLATLVTFLATWLLHSWQWFWIRGRPLFNWKDFSFWMLLCVLVLVTAIYETTRVRKRTLSPSRVTLRQRLRLGLQAAGIFSLMCILWTYWSCQSWAEFQTLIDAASRPTLRELMIVLGVLVLICICAMVWGWSSRETSEGNDTQTNRAPFHFWPSAATVTVGALCLLCAPTVAPRLIPSLKPVVARLHGDVLNARDLALQRRGYYEELDVGRTDNWQWQRKEGAPKGWFQGKEIFSHARADYLLTEIVPSASAVLGGAPAKSNRFGMRDRDYAKAKPPNTYRIVLLGGSHDLGHGVKDNETYENLVEDRLNKKAPDPRYRHYECLNMSVGNTGLIQRVLRLENQGFQFEPDAVILSVGAADRQFFSRHLSKTLSLGIKPPPGYSEMLEEVARKARIDGKMSEIMIERRLQPYIRDLYEWAFRRFARQCAQRGVRPLVVYRPAPVDFEGLELAMHDDMVRLAQAVGLDVIDLSSAFDSITDRNTLIVAAWEQHTNALGHRLIADKLYEPLVRLLFSSPNKQLVSDSPKP